VRDKRKIKVINSEESLMRISKGIVKRAERRRRENMNTQGGGDD
jgi:hypothetical protein